MKHRSESIKFAVGLVCFHKVSNYLCLILDWDYVFTPDKEWRCCGGSGYQDQQPYYRVILPDCSENYIEQGFHLFKY